MRCPSQDDKLRLGGGYALQSPFGTFHVPNISPHKQDGIGSWTPAQFRPRHARGRLARRPASTIRPFPTPPTSA